MENYGYIYKITNLINGKCYIGQTRLSLEKRWSNHKTCHKNTEKNPYPLYFAMNKYGIENFIMEEIEKCKESELNDKEIYWINFYDSYNNGYNATKGGEGYKRFNIPDDEIISSYYELGSITQVSKKYNATCETIRTILLNNNIKLFSLKEIAIKNNFKVLRCENGNILEEYNSISDAIRWIINNNLSNKKFDAIRMELKKTILNNEKFCGFNWIILDNENTYRKRTKVYSLNLKKTNEIKSLNLKKKQKKINKTKLSKKKSKKTKIKKIKIRTRTPEKKLICPICGNPMNRKSEKCLSCYNKQKAQNVPPRDELKELIRNTPFTTIGKMYGVSDKAVSKWCKKYNLPYKKSEIKKYTDEEWNLL